MTKLEKAKQLIEEQKLFIRQQRKPFQDLIDASEQYGNSIKKLKEWLEKRESK